MKEHLDDPGAVVGCRFDVVDVIDCGGEGSFMGKDESLFDVFGAQARVAPDDADHRNVNGRKNVRRGAQQNKRRQQKKKHGCHDERVRAV